MFRKTMLKGITCRVLVLWRWKGIKFLDLEACATHSIYLVNWGAEDDDKRNYWSADALIQTYTDWMLCEKWKLLKENVNSSNKPEPRYWYKCMKPVSFQDSEELANSLLYDESNKVVDNWILDWNRAISGIFECQADAWNPGTVPSNDLRRGHWTWTGPKTPCGAEQLYHGTPCKLM